MIKTDGDAERAGRTGPAIEWEIGTAYDFFLSLWVLHQPAMFNVRAAWTAGMRARLPSDARDTLAKAQDAIIVPIHWIHALDPPKNVETVLWTLGRTPAAERMHALMCGPQERGSRLDELLTGIAERGRWTDRERRDVAALLDEAKGPAKRPKNERVQNLLEICADASGFGDAYLAALRAYQEVFFAEEEQRISYRRRVLHGKIDILRAELVRRLKAQREAGGDVISASDVDRLIGILASDLRGVSNVDVAGDEGDESAED